MNVPRYSGEFGPRNAERLLWRAGFGPAPGEAQAMAALGMEAAVKKLTRPAGAAKLTGAEPTLTGKRPIGDFGMYGQDHLWWFDRMVRTDQPFVERMTLLWHDWFATSRANVDQAYFMRNQNELFRSAGLGSFTTLLLSVTKDEAMLTWLNGRDNVLGDTNENYARELVELFTLGADAGYSEQDVREMARALSGWRGYDAGGTRPLAISFVAREHDSGSKTIFGRTGNFSWRDVCRLVVQHPAHPRFFVTKLWSAFVQNPLTDETRQPLEQLYLRSGRQIRPVVEAILQHPDFYADDAMVKPPVVLAAGMLRVLGRPIDTEVWIEVCILMGQRLFFPPDVGGWDETRWLDSGTVNGRWRAVALALSDRVADASTGPALAAKSPAQAVADVQRFWNIIGLTGRTTEVLERFAAKALPPGTDPAQAPIIAAKRENALRQLVAASPDYQCS